MVRSVVSITLAFAALFLIPETLSNDPPIWMHLPASPVLQIAAAFLLATLPVLVALPGPGGRGLLAVVYGSAVYNTIHHFGDRIGLHEGRAREIVAVVLSLPFLYVTVRSVARADHSRERR